MSAVPQRTQFLIKDLFFQTKYNLSHTQMDLMAYFVNLAYWAICIDGYYAITSHKIMTDMPQIKEKTLEATIKELKAIGLITTTIVEVKKWNKSPKVRGLKLTKKGAEYRNNFVLPSVDPKVRELEKENRELKETIRQLNITQSETTPPKEEEKPKAPTLPTKKDIEFFIEDVTRRFGRSSEPICNLVPQWNKETTFYINSYNRLSYLTPQNEYKQLQDPFQIKKIWHWLFDHSNRIGDKIDFSQTPTIQQLKDRFIGRNIKIGTNQSTINNLVEAPNGVKIEVRTKEDKVGFLIDSKTGKAKIFELGYCQKVILEVLK
jgi:DNA-binding PadR family transcriptional regulator